MSDLLIASSPVEIEAELDGASGSGGFHDQALKSFHQLTSDLELASLDLRTAHGAEWPLHRFYFGPDAGPVAGVVRALGTSPDAWSVPAGPHSNAALPPALFVHAGAGGFTGVLVAFADDAALQRIVPAVERRA